MSGIRWHNMTVCYGRRPVVHHVEAHLPMGSCTALIGRNGAGKSSFLRATIGWMPTTTGTVTFRDQPVSDGDARLHYLPQHPTQAPNVPLSVADVVSQGRFRHVGSWRAFSSEDHALVAQAMDAMALTALAERPFTRLSGGQQQRVRLARALATGAEALLLDEPFAGLDPRAADDLAQRLRAWADAGRLVMFATHELDLARAHASHAFLLNNHLISCGPIAESMTDAHLSAALAAPSRADRA